MNQSQIEKKIDDIYNYVEYNAKPSKLNSGKIVVDREDLLSLLDEVRRCTPEEVGRYKKIIAQREQILNDARQTADNMLEEARQQTAQILDENELVQTAYQRAEEIMMQANEEAQRIVDIAAQEREQMQRASLMYTNDLLEQARKNVEGALLEMDNKYRMLNSAMKNGIQTMQANQDELLMQLEPGRYLHKEGAAPEEERASQSAEMAEEQAAPAEEFDVPEEAFLKNAGQKQ